MSRADAAGVALGMGGPIVWVAVFSLLGGAGAAVGAALVMALPADRRRVALPWLLSYATGTLLGAAFLGMVPQALSRADARTVCALLLAGLVGFFILERSMVWRHGHGRQGPVRGAAAGRIILVGDALHNFVDGVVIAAAFLTSVPLGVAVSLAVIAHEAPQEVGDFAILLEGGYSPRRAFLWNTLSALATVPGAMIAYFWLPQVSAAIPYVLAVSAASFIYIATADLMPMLQAGAPLRDALGQLALLAAGVATIGLLHMPVG